MEKPKSILHYYLESYNYFILGEPTKAINELKEGLKKGMKPASEIKEEIEALERNGSLILTIIKELFDLKLKQFENREVVSNTVMEIASQLKISDRDAELIARYLSRLCMFLLDPINKSFLK